MPTPAEVLSIAKIAEYLWNDTIPKEKGFFNGTIDPRKAIQLYMEWKALNFGITQNISTIPGVSNYVFALCGAKVAIAQEILANGSSGGNVVPGGGGQGVREYSNFAVEGTASITFSEAVNKFAGGSDAIAGKDPPIGGINTCDPTSNGCGSVNWVLYAL